MMNPIDWNACSEEEQEALLMRPAVAAGAEVERIVKAIIDEVKTKGDDALRFYAAKFDKTSLIAIRVSEDDINAASERLSDEFKASIAQAVANIEKFHSAEKLTQVVVETMPGITCHQVTHAIDSVGLYVPGGTAPLFSTVMMLAIPAKIAGCRRIILMTPPPAADEILYTAKVCGVTDIYLSGGAQAVAAMAFGTQSVPKVDKIFGPGNAFVTEAKRQVSQAAQGAAIDMPAGPSEVLVIADARANADFVAADLLSQAEHGPDSQVILLTNCESFAQKVNANLATQLEVLPRKAIAEKSLSASRLIVARDMNQCVEIANRYAPEHIILETQNARELALCIRNAGSVFVGDWSTESAGDYASGTNHVLPTYGYAKTYSSLGLADFERRMTIQEVSPEGLLALGPVIECLAAAERLGAHKNAVTVRLTALKNKE